jgi:hypothetical protein
VYKKPYGDFLMSDEPNDTTPTTEIIPSSNLIQRLDRRHNHPLGLINTRQSPSSLLQLPVMLQRSALLQQIQTRYGVSDRSSGTGTELPFANSSPKTTGEQTSMFTSEAPMPAASFANDRSATSTLSATSNQAPTAKFRISRRAVPSGSESFPSNASSHPLSSPTQLTSPLVLQKATSENLEQDDRSQPMLRAKPSTNNIFSPTQTFSSVAVEANAPLVLRKDATESLDRESQPEPMLRAKPLTNNISSPIKTFSSVKVEANTPLVLRKETTINQDGSSANPMVLSQGSGTNLESDFPASKLAVAVPLVKTRSAHLAVQRQPDRLAISREIPSNMDSKTHSTMVWSQTSQSAIAGNNFSDASNGGRYNSLPLAITSVHRNRQTNALQASPANMLRTMTRSNPTTSMPGQAAMPIPEINLAEIAEQVSRILCRQLTVERERRGFRK